MQSLLAEVVPLSATGLAARICSVDLLGEIPNCLAQLVDKRFEQKWTNPIVNLITPFITFFAVWLIALKSGMF